MKQILIICGGQSAEHEVSIQSACNIIRALDKEQFQAVVVVVSRSGSWYLLPHASFLESITEYIDNQSVGSLCTLMRQPNQTVLMNIMGDQIKIDAAFPLIHGPMGEDGTLQGLLELMGVPFVGCGVLASAIGMDKDFLKRSFSHANIPVVPFITVSDKKSIPAYRDVCQRLQSSVLFVKPAVMGSSVGVIKVSSEGQYEPAIEQAFCYGFKILIEKYISCREVECSVLGNSTPIASCVGEIKPNHEFYSYEAKYLDPDGAELVVPADLSLALSENVRNLALKAFAAVECKGLARVDFFISEDQTVYVNELNTIPGFTAISMYPKLWEASGIHYTHLITQLIQLAFEEYGAKQKIHLKPTLSHQSFDFYQQQQAKSIIPPSPDASIAAQG